MWEVLGGAVVEWLVSKGLDGAVARWAVKRNLTTKVQECISEWADENGLNVRSLATQLLPDNESSFRECQAMAEVADQLKERRIPTKELWRRALCQRWKHLSEKQGRNHWFNEFFKVEEGQAFEYLDSLATRLHKFCCEVDELFKPEILDELANIKVGIEDILDKSNINVELYRAILRNIRSIQDGQWGTREVQSEIAVYSDRFLEEINGERAQYKLRDPSVDFCFSYEIAVERSDKVVRLSAPELDTFVKSESATRCVVLYGPGGSGKSTIIGGTGVRLLEEVEGPIPILLNLKDWGPKQQVLEDAGSAFAKKQEQFDALLNLSIVPMDYAKLQRFAQHRGVLLIADGLNEAGPEMRAHLLTLLPTILTLQGGDTSCLLATDRLRFDARADENSEREKRLLELLAAEAAKVEKVWQATLLLPLAEQERRCGLGDVVYNALHAKEQEIVGPPYYLDAMMASEIPQLGSELALHERQLKSQLRIEDSADVEQFRGLGAALFSAIREGGRTTTFPRSCFEEGLSGITLVALEGAGVIRQVDAETLKCDHQLRQDFLLGCYVATTQDEWDRRIFDVVSPDADSPQALLMALERISTPSIGDRLLERIFDWNWRAAVSCLVGSRRSEDELCSAETRIAILSHVADKLRDPVEHTRERSRQELERFPDSESAAFLSANSSGNLPAPLLESSECEWFVLWRDLFALHPSRDALLERHVDYVIHLNSLIGWTAVSVIRRYGDLVTSGNQPVLRQLRAFFKCHRDDNVRDEVFRWRAVHALGVSPCDENEELLREALDDNYPWVNYGAVRSIIEMIAKDEDPDRRKRVIDDLCERAQNKRLSNKVMVEAWRAAFFTNPSQPDAWEEETKRMLSSFSESCGSSAESEGWAKRIELFTQFLAKSEQEGAE